MKKSRVYKLEGYTFRYDYDNSVVEWVTKATADEIADDKEWMERNGRPLWGVDEHGYIVNEAVGLSAEHWKDKEARDEYLSGWIDELDEEAAYLADEFERYELPYLL